MLLTKGLKLLLPTVNYLAHIILSGNDPLLLVGNFMGDGVKGASLDHLHPTVANGVRLHRAIDSYTDAHPMALQGRERLRSTSGKYAGVVLDMFYDHVLALNWANHSQVPLSEFLGQKFNILNRNIEHMPARIQYMLPHMIKGDWLASYASIDGLSKALNGIASRASKGDLIAGSESVLVEHLDQYSSEFNRLFADVSDMCNELISSFEE